MGREREKCVRISLRNESRALSYGTCSDEALNVITSLDRMQKQLSSLSTTTCVIIMSTVHLSDPTGYGIIVIEVSSVSHWPARNVFRVIHYDRADFFLASEKIYIVTRLFLQSQRRSHCAILQ